MSQPFALAGILVWRFVFGVVFGDFHDPTRAGS